LVFALSYVQTVCSNANFLCGTKIGGKGEPNLAILETPLAGALSVNLIGSWDVRLAFYLQKPAPPALLVTTQTH
jgi:hypothetical protein